MYSRLRPASCNCERSGTSRTRNNCTSWRAALLTSLSLPKTLQRLRDAFRIQSRFLYQALQIRIPTSLPPNFTPNIRSKSQTLCSPPEPTVSHLCRGPFCSCLESQPAHLHALRRPPACRTHPHSTASFSMELWPSHLERTVSLLWLLLLRPWLLCFFPNVFCARNVFSYLLSCGLLSNSGHKLFNIYPKASSMFYIQQTPKKKKKKLWMNKWMNFLYRKIHTSVIMLEEWRSLEILIHASAWRFPGSPDGLKNATALPLFSQIAFLSHPPPPPTLGVLYWHL